MTPDNTHDSSTQPSTTENNVDILGIISLGLSLIGMPFVGFIVGLVGASIAKKENRPVAVSRAGWVFGLALTVFISIVVIAAIVIAILTAETR